MQRPGVHERRRHEAPPLPVGRERSDTRAPCEKRLRIVERRAGEQHASRDCHADRGERRRDDKVRRARSEPVTECVGLGAPLYGRRRQLSSDVEDHCEASLALRRRRQAVRNRPEDRKEDEAGHSPAKRKNCATLWRN